MKILPDDYKQIGLTRSEKIFIRYASNSNMYGYLLLKINPAMIENESINIIITDKGVILLKIFENLNNSDIFNVFMKAFKQGIFDETVEIISKKLLTNKALSNSEKGLYFPVNYICVFPSCKKRDIDESNLDDDIRDLFINNCMFEEQFTELRSNFDSIIYYYLNNSMIRVSNNPRPINDNNINSIMQRLAPEYTIIRIGKVVDVNIQAGADNELLVVDEKDIAVKAFMLETDQVNLVNKITKGDQLILACAGSGKSVLLISKCFKVARMNPSKKFLITCYNKNLQSLYLWYIDRAGLKERNVDCITFHSLCKKLLENNNCYVPNDIDDWPNEAIRRFNQRDIEDRYYGIFIDEVQMFDQEWYKLCFNLLENKNTEDHLFIICGDKTQKLKQQQKHGRAPWNAGEGYPNYRGGSKNIRIEKNYRNCIQINEYINRFVANAKSFLYSVQGNDEIDPDMFLRGQAFKDGIGVTIKDIAKSTNTSEADAVLESIDYIHNNHKIPYDEIAVIMYNKSYKAYIPGWKMKYNLETPLLTSIKMRGIPYVKMYSSNNEYSERYGSDWGVSLISCDSVLGLDFRAVIVCGLKPLGFYDKTKKLNLEQIKNDKEELNILLESVKKNISYLYVACTRAKEVLHIIAPESSKDSIYINILKQSL